MSYKDLMGREINIGDYVIFYCAIHQVQEKQNRGALRLKEIDSDEQQSVSSDNLCIVDAEDVLAWKLRRGY
jgi:hypothetical protein